MAAPATGGMTPAQFWHTYGKPRNYPRSLSYSSGSSTLTAADLNDVTGYGDFADIFLQYSLSVAIPAGKQAKISPYFPFNLVRVTNDVGGVVQQGVDSYVHYIEMLTRKNDGSDPGYVGEGGSATNDVSTDLWDLSASPGSLIGSATSTAAQTVALTANFWFRYYFRQDPVDVLTAYGYMPYGSETFRPHLNFSLPANWTGTDPWANPVLNNGTTPVVTVTSIAGTVNWHALNIPFLPYGFSGSVPNLTVGMARFTAADSVPITGVGSLIPIRHRVAMVYHKIIHCVYVNSAADTADVTDFELDANAASDGIIWQFNDANLLSYHSVNLRRYGRLLPSGVLVADMQSGQLPDQQLGSELMTPDQSLAQAFALPLTPTMQTGITISGSVALNSADTSNIKMAALGLQPVNY